MSWGWAEVGLEECWVGVDPKIFFFSFIFWTGPDPTQPFQFGPALVWLSEQWRTLHCSLLQNSGSEAQEQEERGKETNLTVDSWWCCCGGDEEKLVVVAVVFFQLGWLCRSTNLCFLSFSFSVFVYSSSALVFFFSFPFLFFSYFSVLLCFVFFVSLLYFTLFPLSFIYFFSFVSPPLK